jgi:hypothetical protein
VPRHAGPSFEVDMKLSLPFVALAALVAVVGE